MALSFDDRILGEKTDYYCSSSEDERYDSCEENFDESEKTKTEKIPTVQASEITDYSGHSLNVSLLTYNIGSLRSSENSFMYYNLHNSAPFRQVQKA